MSFLAELNRYLTVRRQLGANLSTDERILRRFASFADHDGVASGTIGPGQCHR